MKKKLKNQIIEKHYKFESIKLFQFNILYDNFKASCQTVLNFTFLSIDVSEKYLVEDHLCRAEPGRFITDIDNMVKSKYFLIYNVCLKNQLFPRYCVVRRYRKTAERSYRLRAFTALLAMRGNLRKK